MGRLLTVEGAKNDVPAETDRRRKTSRKEAAYFDKNGDGSRVIVRAPESLKTRNTPAQVVIMRA
jgi:hypothetical protein